MKTSRSGAAIFELRAARLRLLRAVHDLRARPRRFAPRPAATLTIELAKSETRLRAEFDDDARLTDGKIANLRIAVRHLDGIVVPAGATFSLWRHLGKPSASRGFVRGRELREGCLVPTIGGGLCQLSNAFYACALDANFEILERHAHSQRVPGSQAAVDRDATLFWNYIDLRFRATRDFVIDARLSDSQLVVSFRAAPLAVGTSGPSKTALLFRLDDLLAPSIGTCTTCDTSACHRHEPGDPARLRSPGRTAFLLDGIWPEFDSYVRDHVGPDDLARIPIDGRRFRVARYAWTTGAFAHVEEFRAIALRRTIRSRIDQVRTRLRPKTQPTGGTRQRAALEEAERLAGAYARALPSDVRHVVVAQSLLPFLWMTGELGGRSFDVLMSAPPMAEIHSILDAGARAHPESTTFADFRAPAALIDAERAALAAARAVVTPHATVAASFGSRGVLLPWARVPRKTVPTGDGSRDAIVFAGSTLGRAGAYEMRAAARALRRPLIVTAERDLEAPGFWNGVDVTRATYADALKRAAVVVSPAYIESQPRRALTAIALGIPVIATTACGLEPSGAVTIVPIGDAAALASAIDRALHAEARPTTLL